MVNRILAANRSNHIFTSSEKEMGVSTACSLELRSSLRRLLTCVQAYLHNHVVYHALSLFALGASPELILAQSKRNFTYQLPPPKLMEEKYVEEMMSGPAGVEKYLGDEDHFLDFIEFFERKIDSDGPEKVLQDYLLGDSAIAKSIYPRLWHGITP